ncbi:MAG: peptidoglycan bridge formation glycyltransferase FemA/FemB family protein, partial [Candidatus Lokiarchaeota archaeon]|nr:peptidoglycan bridge formation glycyltransferase FemA/FemB family protein [Candidatus Lokiarchaeota archaeon]
IAGAVYFKFDDRILYKFGASYPKFNELRGNNAVMWFAIQKYLNENYKEFDFGRTEIIHEGLRRFKLGWNTEERFIYTTRYNIKSDKFLPVETKTEGFHNKIFSKSPTFVLKIIGSTLYKHVG